MKHPFQFSLAAERAIRGTCMGEGGEGEGGLCSASVFENVFFF